jgi:hypothetical protein
VHGQVLNILFGAQNVGKVQLESFSGKLVFFHPLFKMVGLHYTPFSQAPIADTILPSHQASKSREFKASMTNLG